MKTTSLPVRLTYDWLEGRLSVEVEKILPPDIWPTYELDHFKENKHNKTESWQLILTITIEGRLYSDYIPILKGMERWHFQSCCRAICDRLLHRIKTHEGELLDNESAHGDPTT